MNAVTANDLPQFLRRFRFPGGRVRGVRVAYPAGKGAAVEFRLSVYEGVRDPGPDAKRVRLRLSLGGVDEFRFQMRPGQPKVRIADARVVFLNGLFFVNLDAWTLEPGEQPRVFDFRASEVYAAGRDLSWEVTPPGEPKA